MNAIDALFSLFIVVMLAIIAGGVVRFLYALNLVRIKWYWMMIASWLFYQFCVLLLALTIIVRWLTLGLPITVTRNNFDYGFYLLQLIVYCVVFCLTLAGSEETQTSQRKDRIKHKSQVNVVQKITIFLGRENE